MTEAQEQLKAEIEKITDEATIEKVKTYIMSILTQQDIEHDESPPLSR